MMRKKHHRQIGAILCVITAGSASLFGGCGLFPEEEEDRKVQYVESAAELDYEQEVVTVESIVDSEKIHCNYQQTKEELLSFDVDDEMIREVLVTRGDEVKAGDVIARLDVTSEESALKQLNYQIEKNEKKKADQAELLTYDLQETDVKYNSGWFEDYEDYVDAVNDVYESYNDTIESIDDELYIQYMQKEAYEERIADSYLYAGIDGTVSYVTLGLEGTSTKAGDTIARIIDTSQMYFVADTKYASYFEEGESVMVTCGTETYETIAGLDPEDDQALYLTLTSTDANIAYNAQGTVELILAEAEDVLTISKSSVNTNGDMQYVYQIDENGMRVMTEITTGISGGGRIEVTSGLSAGDIIIKD